MKKNNIFYACAAAALIFASCQKEGPAAEVIESASTDLNVITATTTQTKTTTYDGLNVLWENGDAIVLRAHLVEDQQPVVVKYTTTLTEPNATATFVKDESEQNSPTLVDGKYVAVYPANLVYSNWSKSPYVVLAPNKVQKVETTGWDPQSALMLGVGENTNLVFSHIVSYVKFTIDENTTPFNKVTVSSLNIDQEIVSRIYVYFDGNYTFQTGKTQCGKLVTFTKADETNFGPGTYYIAINPDTYDNGLKFTFENGTAADSKVSPANVVMTPGDVADMGTIGTLNFPTVSDKLGTVYAENGVNQGVVFWVDETDPTKGKVISAQSETNLVWGSSLETTNGYSWAKDIDSDDGVANQTYVLGLSGSKAETYPAVYFCKSLGDGWRLPTVNELETLVKTYYGVVGTLVTDTDYYQNEPYLSNAAKFDAKLSECVAGEKIVTDDATWYWTGQGDSSNDKIYRVKVGHDYYKQSAKPTGMNDVRCVRDVVLK